MKQTSTQSPRSADRRAAKRETPTAATWGAERVLLVCLLGIGLLGLVMTYGSRLGSIGDAAAAKPHTLEADGKLQRDRMILRLNQRSLQKAQAPDSEVSQL